MSNKFYVYMYMDQDNIPFYIGKGKGNRCRTYAHKVGHTASKIKSIGGCRNVKIHFLHKDITEAEAYSWEKYWIKYFGRRDLGTGQLTNHTKGGEGQHRGKPGKIPWNKGKPRTEETKQLLSKSLKGRFTAETSTNWKAGSINKNTLVGRRVRARKLGKKVPIIYTQSKLTSLQVKEIRQKYIKGIYGYTRLGKEYNVSPMSIKAIISRKTWKHVV